MTTTTTPQPPPNVPRRESVTAWARAHGRHVRGWFHLDNYEPHPRATAYVDLYFYATDTCHDGVIIDGLAEVREATRAVYLVDNGRTVRPYYVASWNPADGSYVIAHAFPVNINADGTPRMRADDRRPVDFGSWAVGPRRAYHVKVGGEI